MPCYTDEHYKSISVDNGQVWALQDTGVQPNPLLVYREGITNDVPCGTRWIQINTQIKGKQYLINIKLHQKIGLLQVKILLRVYAPAVLLDVDCGPLNNSIL